MPAGSRQLAHPMLLELRKVEKSFAGQRVLRGISFGVEAGETVALLGPSGCGKTTLLRIVAGLEKVDSGQLLLLGNDLTQIPIHERGFGMVFQDYTLFPHKNVFENVVFGLRMHGWSLEERTRRVEQVLDLVGLRNFETRSVHELSGGEQQRVALARSLAPSPRLLLLDEPLGSLDRALRERLMFELRSILKQAGSLLGQAAAVTAIYVTHDQEEAFAIADRILVIRDGLIEQSGTPEELYSHPRTPYVARFLGMENLLKAQIVSREPPKVQTALGMLTVRSCPIPASGDRVLLIRPEAAELVATSEAQGNLISGRLEGLSFRGLRQIATIVVPAGDGNMTLKFSFESQAELPSLGAQMTFRLNATQLIVLE